MVVRGGVLLLAGEVPLEGRYVLSTAIKAAITALKARSEAFKFPATTSDKALKRSLDRLRTSIHHEYDSPLGIGAIPSEMRLTAPMPWGGIVFMMNTRRE